MIEHIRKYTGLTMVILVILFVSFLFLDSHALRGGMGGHAIMKIADRTYSDKEYRSLGVGGYELASILARSGDFGMYQFIMGLTPGATGREDDAEKFFVGRMILRNAKEEFGVFPGENEIDEYIKSLRAFAGPDGKFNPETYRNYIQKGIGRLGLTEGDVRELASDVLASRVINSIVGSGLTVDRDAVAKNMALENQQITGEIARLDIAPYEEKIQPTEEEIKAYWDVIQDSFTTAPRRKFTYVLVKPDFPADTAESTPEKSIADATASDEAKKKKEEEEAKKNVEKAEARRKKQLEVDSLIDDFVNDLTEKKGASLEELAAANKWEVKKTELFTADQAPEELKIKTRANSRAQTAADQLFSIVPTSDPISKLSGAVAVGENEWLVARLDEEEKSRPKTYAEARDEARAQLIAEKAAEALKAAAKEIAEKIKASIASGKSFADAAKDAGINETKSFTSITSTYRPEAASEPQNLFTASKNVDPGSLGEVIMEPDRAFIVHVAKREVVKDPASRLESEVTARARENETVAFVSWMNARIEDAKVEQLYKR